MAALLCRRELILEVNACGTSLDHSFHQFEGIQRATESGLGVGHERCEPGLRGRHLPRRVMHLAGALSRVVAAAPYMGYAVGRVKALIGIHLACVVRIRRDFPSADDT